VSDTQKDHPKSGSGPSQSQSIGHFLLGLADLFELLVDTLRKFGQYLIETTKDNPSEHD
jgi:hypothetical protein